MAKQFYFDRDNFKKTGLLALEDTTLAPPGSFSILQNCFITDQGGISPRPGTVLIGSQNNSSKFITGLFNFRKSFGSNEILIKTYDTTFEAYSKNNQSADWFTVKTGYTADKEHGFISSLVNTDNQDYVISCNRYEPFQRWTAAVTTLSSNVSVGAGVVPVASILNPDIYEDKIASSSSATTLTVSGTPWAASQWINFYVYIPSSGKIRPITANTNNVITFSSLGSDPGLVEFQIRTSAFPATGSIIYGGVITPYTSIDIATQFIVSSAAVGTSGMAVTLVPETFPGAPRGNRLTSLLGRIIVGNVRSALSLDSGAALQGYSTAGSYFVSKLKNPTDFSYSSPRVPGEGDVVSTPYGGGDINAVEVQESSAYIFKSRYVEGVQYTQDGNDLPNRTPLQGGIGSINKVIKGTDNIYFITADKKFMSIGRIKLVDQLPQTRNIGLKIKRILDTIDPSQVSGWEYKDKIYITYKSSSIVAHNDTVLVYNKINDIFEGVWDISAFGFEFWNEMFIFGESNSANVYQLLVGTADVIGSVRNPISFNAVSHFMNLTASKANLQALNSIFFEGYIDAATTVTLKSYKDFESTPFLSFNFSGTESKLLNGTISGAFLGGKPVALKALGSISNPDPFTGKQHFQFRIYIPYIYGNYFAFGTEGYGTDMNFELTRVGLGMKEDAVVDTSKIKSVS